MQTGLITALTYQNALVGAAWYQHTRAYKPLAHEHQWSRSEYVVVPERQQASSSSERDGEAEREGERAGKAEQKRGNLGSTTAVAGVLAPCEATLLLLAPPFLRRPLSPATPLRSLTRSPLTAPRSPSTDSLERVRVRACVCCIGVCWYGCALAPPPPPLLLYSCSLFSSSTC